MSGETCDVCGGSAVGVACGACGPISFAYCAACLQIGAEPFGMLASYIACSGAESIEELRSDYTRIIDATCDRAGKTTEEFWSEVKRLSDQIDREMNGGLPSKEEVCDCSFRYQRGACPFCEDDQSRFDPSG